MTDYLRGHKIERLGDEFAYSDTKTPTANNVRACGYCGLGNTKEGHDGCLGELPGIMNACCGHGVKRDAYVQFLDGVSIHGESAGVILDELKKLIN